MRLRGEVRHFLSHAPDTIERMFAILLEVEGSESVDRAYLESGPAGADYGSVVASHDVERLSGPDRVHLLRAQQRMVSHLQASMYRTIASIAEVFEDGDPTSLDCAASEIRAALRLTRRTADNEMAFALDLTRRLPQVLRALDDGRIDLARARTIVRGTMHLSPAVAGEVADAVIGEAPQLTTAQLRNRLRELCAEADPADAEERYEHSHADRKVVVEASENGTAHLHAYDLAPQDAQAIATRIHRTALATSGDDTGRTMDQRRADAFVDICRSHGRREAGHGEAGSRAGGSVDLVVDVRTLAGLTEHAGELGGYGPVVAEVARKVAVDQMDGRWTYTVSDGDTVVTTGTLRRRPTTSLRRLVEARDRTCVFPGCRMPSTDCDLDHRVEVQDGGRTTEDNLSPLCRHDHRLKSTRRWRYERTADNHIWTSPLGLRYTTSGRPP